MMMLQQQQHQHHHHHLHLIPIAVPSRNYPSTIPPPPPPVLLLLPTTRKSTSPTPSSLLLLLSRHRRHTPSSAPAAALPNHDDDDGGVGDGYTCIPDDANDNDVGAKQDIAVAIDAVSDILHQYVGLSSEESLLIASNSPNYIQSLIHSVHDLEWTHHSTSTNTNNPPIDFKKSVIEMALDKDERGMVPFLEYLGLSLPTSMYLARSHHLHSLTLPLLLPKVKFLKEIFFSGSENGGGGGSIIAQKANNMMMHLSIPHTDEDLQHTLSFFDKIQARHGCLDSLGSGDVSFRFLIESFPHLLSLPTDSRLKPMVKFLEDSGVPKGCLSSVLLLFPSIISYDIEKDVKPRLQAFNKVNAGDKDFGKMLVKYPWILSTSIQKNYMDVLSFFRKEKVAEDSIQRAIKRWPPLLGCSISKLRSMVEQLRELGVNNKTLGKVIVTSPQLLMRKPREFRQVVSCLLDLGLDDETIGEVLGRCPEIFAASVQGTLKKKVDFLKDLGISRVHLPRVIRKYPELLVLNIDRAMLQRVKYLMEMGLSRGNVLSMVRRFSPLLGYSVEGVLRPKIDFLVKTMGRPVKEVVGYPRYFSYCSEKRIRRRYWVLKSRGVECSLEEMLGKNDEEFAAEYL